MSIPNKKINSSTPNVGFADKSNLNELVKKAEDRAKVKGGVLLSKEHNSFIWMPAKTGTSHAFQILKHFGFKHYEYSFEDMSLTPLGSNYNHNINLPPHHETYKVLSTARNPYSRMVSFFKYTFYNHNNIKPSADTMNYTLSYNKNDSFELVKEKFGTFINNVFFETRFINIVSTYKTERTPDYFIRVENLYEDYCNIPFIKDSEFNVSGKLKSYCSIIENKSVDERNYKLFYNKDYADIVYYNTSKYFELLNYDRKSWQ